MSFFHPPAPNLLNLLVFTGSIGAGETTWCGELTTGEMLVAPSRAGSNAVTPLSEQFPSGMRSVSRKMIEIS